MRERQPNYAPDGVAPRSPMHAGSHVDYQSASGIADAALAQLPLAVAVINADLRLLYWNDSASRLFGSKTDCATDLPLLSQILPSIANLTLQQCNVIALFVANQTTLDSPVEAASLLRVSLGRERGIVLQVRRLDAGRWMLVIDDGALSGAAMQDGGAKGDAWLDALTGLSNRRHLDEVLHDLVAGASTGIRHALLMIDLDRFKPINDTLGHTIGDATLRLVSQRLRREIRKEDLLVRLGGDEFVILIPHGERDEALAERVVEVLSRPFLVEGHIVNIGASVGIARFPEHGQTPADLLRHADLALYDAKSAGKRTWRMFAPALEIEARTKRDLESDLRKALALGELSLEYQPQLNLRTQTLTGFEALLRWHHPVRGSVSPTVFIPVAEEIGYIVALGEWVLKTACLEAARWPAPLRVAVNVSPRQLEDSQRLFRAVTGALEAARLDPERLELEITESSLMSMADSVLDTLHRFRARGIRIAMDDFGTGYSSLGQLRSFPFSKIKIDRSFITCLAQEADAAAVVRAIAAMGAGLGMTTTAEGVETSEQAALVEADGCTDIQGYLISRPVPVSQIDSLLKLYNIVDDPIPATETESIPS